MLSIEHSENHAYAIAFQRNNSEHISIVLSVLCSSISKFRHVSIFAGLGLSTFFFIVLEHLLSFDYVSFLLLEQLLKLKNICLSLYIQKIFISSIEV